MATVEEHVVLDAATRSEIGKLLERAGAAGRGALSEHKRLALAHGDEHAVHLLVRVRGELVMYGQLLHSDAGPALELCVAEPSGVDGLECAVAVLDRARDLAATRGDTELVWFAPRPGALEDALTTRLGPVTTRELYELRRPLPLGDDLAVLDRAMARPFLVGADEDALIELNAAAFADHPEQGRWTRADLERRIAEDWFDAEGLLLDEIDGVLIGFCWTKRHRGPEPLGEIYVIGIAPAQQGRGLGRALVLAGLDHLADRGERTAMLYVDADNSPAVNLYRGLGFSVDHVDRIITIALTSR